MNANHSQLSHTFAEALVHDLASPLPGEVAQDKMAPQPRSYAEHHGRPVTDAKVNGVLLLFYPHKGEVFLPLILRPIYPGVHSGQVSFPGGKIEDADADVVACALREAQEEIGVEPAVVQVLGQLSTLYIGASNNIVYPVVSWTNSRPIFHTDEREVAMLIETPLDTLLDPANLRKEQREVRGRKASVPYFLVSDQIVWGATAMILGEMLELKSIKGRHL